MEVRDLTKQSIVTTEPELRQLLRSVRHGQYGAFVLLHDEEGPFLHIHINGSVAYLHYFLDYSGDSAGFQARDMDPPNCPSNAHFLQTSGLEGASFDMPGYTLVDINIAYDAAVEFLASEDMPPSIEWTEL